MESTEVREVLIELHNDCGRLTPPLVVASAKKKSSPLHDLFEWDDEKAGHAYRLKQARDLIRRVYVTVVRNNEEVKEHVFFHTCDAENEPVYYTKEVLIGNVSLLEEAERQAIVKLKIALRTLTELQEISGATKKKKRTYQAAQKHISSALSIMQ